MLDEAERNAGFRRQVKAALAGKSGPNAIVKLVDWRLSGLARAERHRHVRDRDSFGN